MRGRGKTERQKIKERKQKGGDTLRRERESERKQGQRRTEGMKKKKIVTKNKERDKQEGK